MLRSWYQTTRSNFNDCQASTTGTSIYNDNGFSYAIQVWFSADQGKPFVSCDDQKPVCTTSFGDAEDQYRAKREKERLAREARKQAEANEARGRSTGRPPGLVLMLALNSALAGSCLFYL